MKTLAWNCRGLTRSSAIRNLRVQVRKHSLDVLFLSETKTLPSVASNILNNLGYYSLVHVPPVGSKG
jgi:exonuclease III